MILRQVIRALYDYEANPDHPQELTFARGDFFHVIGRENDVEWYEACNPSMPNARGLVPVNYFQVLGKNERDSAGSITSTASQRLPDNDSGYSDRSGGSGVANGADLGAGSRPVRFSKSVGKGSGAMVYGIVMYDFKAERADELDAKAGEAVIVIAQSNPEWFVAKPIGRLGGPGLIPVSFIEIRDMSSNQAVPNAQEAVQRAGVPKVEEWKKMAADYKNSSISLGKFESGNAQQAPSDMDRTSMMNGGQGHNNGLSNGEHVRPLLGPRPTLKLTLDSLQPLNHHQSQRPGDFEDSWPSSSNALYPVKATVSEWRFVDDKYWYTIDAEMSDGSKTTEWRLFRLYSDFYDIQIALLQTYPFLAGNKGEPRKLPFMPGPVTYVTDTISTGRRENLNQYLANLLSMQPEFDKDRKEVVHVPRLPLVVNFFAPREGDFEAFSRLSDASQPSSTNSPGDVSHQSSRANLNGNGYGQPGLSAPPPRSGIQQGGDGVAQAVHYRTPSDLRPPELDRQPSSLTQASNSSHPSASSQSSGALKIKVFYEEEIIAIRVPTNVSFDRLKEKLKERLSVRDGFAIQYMDEPTNQYLDMRHDGDLKHALQRNPKLTLYVMMIDEED